MEYTLKQYDIPLLKFTAIADSSEPEIEILWWDVEKTHLLPLDLELTPDGLNRWLRHRTIPRNRAYVHNLLAKCGLNLNRPLNIIHVCKGLSLNDSYWVAEEGDQSTFDKVNLYENPFSNVLAALAFTGYGSSPRTAMHSSPEFTTNGMLPKCWRRVSGKVYLYKGGTEGASNTGFEPYSEFYTAQVAQAMGINAIPYNLSKWKGRLCSTCELFAGKDAWESDKALEEYISTLAPCVYDDFIGTAKANMDHELHEKLRRLLTFRFKAHSRYNLPAMRLRMIERQVQKRARLLWGE